MHDSSYSLGRIVLALFATPGRRVLEVGSRIVTVDVGDRKAASLRDFRPEGIEYVGLDQEPGDGVDVVGTSHQMPFESNSFDLVVSTSALEHDEFFWLTFTEMARVARPGGLVYLNVPAKGPYHAYPVDCWRFYPDAGQALVRWARRAGGPDIQLLEQFQATCTGRQVWTDNVCLFGKGPGPFEVPSLREESRKWRTEEIHERWEGVTP